MEKIAIWFANWFAARRDRKRQHEVNHVRRTWLASGVSTGRNNARGDAGVWEVPNCTRAEALATITRISPRAAILHIDEINFIITYQI
jgi:hypothetical protein